MFYRKALIALNDWAISSNRKPLVLRGARQVGKTTVVTMLADSFDTFVNLNLDKSEDAKLFENDLNIKDLIQKIFLEKNITPHGKTLIFIDEIQNSARAVQLMRYFYEEAPEYYVIAAGSLLEVIIESMKISFPVGRVEYLYLYPLSFQEFLKATEETQALNYYQQVPVAGLAIPKLMDLFHRYTLIGGMPEIVQRYTANKDIVSLKPLYQALLTSYTDDVPKYARNQPNAQLLRRMIEVAPLEAGKRIKFEGFGNTPYRSRDVGEALRTLERAMLLYLCYPTSELKPPISLNTRKSPRLQFLDTGLLNYAAGLQSYYFDQKDLNAIYQGKITEHIVGQELIALDSYTNHNPAFWVRELKQSNAKVDYVVQYENQTIPIEIKSGLSGTLRSLHQFVDAASHNFAVRLWSGSLELTKQKTPKGKEYVLLNLPYCFAEKINEYIGWGIAETARKTALGAR